MRLNILMHTSLGALFSTFLIKTLKIEGLFAKVSTMNWSSNQQKKSKEHNINTITENLGGSKLNTVLQVFINDDRNLLTWQKKPLFSEIHLSSWNVFSEISSNHNRTGQEPILKKKNCGFGKHILRSQEQHWGRQSNQHGSSFEKVL